MYCFNFGQDSYDCTDDTHLFNRSDFINSLGHIPSMDMELEESDLVGCGHNCQEPEPYGCNILETVNISSGEATQKFETDLRPIHAVPKEKSITSLYEFKTGSCDTLNEPEEKVTSKNCLNNEDGPKSNSPFQKHSRDICYTDASSDGLNLCSSILKLKTSPTKPKKTLSLSTLEAIQESDLDHSLESSGNIHQGYSGEESDPFTDSNSNSCFSPCHMLGQEMKSFSGAPNTHTAQLMEELHLLSMAQTGGYSAEIEKGKVSAVTSTIASQYDQSEE